MSKTNSPEHNKEFDEEFRRLVIEQFWFGHLTEKTEPLPEPLPCPFCDSLDLEFKYRTSSGHGDCGFTNARIECNNCSGAKGDGSGYGEPTHEDELKAWTKWNERL
jgi:hypothetical protein